MILSAFKIEKGIPPPKQEHHFVQYPFREMRVGDSFAAPIQRQRSVAAAASRYGRIAKAKFTVRKQSKTHCRCWRIA
jgi:hypothetical protein